MQYNHPPPVGLKQITLQDFFPIFFNSNVFFMTPSLGLTMITLVAAAGLRVRWQRRAGVTQQALAVLLIVFYVSLQTAMNVAIQRRMRGRAGG